MHAGTVNGNLIPPPGQAKILRDGPRTFGVNCLFWPPILALNMRYVALHNQATIGGVGHAIWNIFLAYMANRGETNTRKE